MSSKPTLYVLTANKTLVAEKVDVEIIANAVDLVVTLPAATGAAKGNRVRVFVAVASTTTGFTLQPRATDSLRGNGITVAAGKGWNNSPATDAIGDTTDLLCDGNGNWLVMTTRGTWARSA